LTTKWVGAEFNTALRVGKGVLVVAEKENRLALSNKQQVFINEYLVDFNATQAAIRAGYSEKTARSIGSENLSKPDISAEIKRRIEERAMTASEVMIRLSDMARGDMGDFLDIGPMGFVVDLNEAKKRGLTKLIKKVKLRTQTSVSKEGIETETHDMEIELYDAQSALVHNGKHLKLFTDQVQISGEVGIIWDLPTSEPQS
jgi:phage terminase small subunit